MVWSAGLRPLFKLSFLRVWMALIGVSLLGCVADKPVRKSELAVQGLYAAALSQNGEAVVLGSIQHGGSYWTLGTQFERRFNWDHQKDQEKRGHSALTVVALSRDNRFALTADERRFVVWSTQTGESIGFWQVDGKITGAAFSDGGAFALVGLDNFEALYVDVKQGGFVHKLIHAAAIQDVAISADGGLGVTATEAGLVQVWVLKAAKSIRQWEHDGPVNCIAIDAKGEHVFTFGSSVGGQIWDARKNERLLEIPLSNGSVTAARFHDHKPHLLLGTSARETALWNWSTKKQLQRWIAPKKSLWKPEGIRLYDVAFTRSEKHVLSVASNGALYVWDVATP
ncbi:MAG: hypothetical protein P8176_04755 [Gammaproteobacteria bacterium]